MSWAAIFYVIRSVADFVGEALKYLTTQQSIELGERRERGKADEKADELIARANRARDAVDGLPDDDPDNRDRG